MRAPSLPTCVRHRGAKRLGYEGELEFSGGHVGEGQHETQAGGARTGEAADVHRGVQVEAPAGGVGASCDEPGSRVHAEARAPLLVDEQRVAGSPEVLRVGGPEPQKRGQKPEPNRDARAEVERLEQAKLIIEV